MSPAHVLEPTYRRLKRALMEGIWPGGAKLEAMRLAEDFGVSMTPVRDSLNQLVGEGLVDLTPGEGFRVPPLTEQRLRDLLDVNAVLLETANKSNWRLPAEHRTEVNGHEYADRLASAFSTLAMGSGNRFLAHLVERISERLHPVRSQEAEIFPKPGETLERIESSLRGSAAHRSDVLRRYHRQCQENVPRLIDCLTN
jgi:DNA-binding GntR family transcriptional regulator